MGSGEGRTGSERGIGSGEGGMGSEGRMEVVRDGGGG